MLCKINVDCFKIQTTACLALSCKVLSEMLSWTDKTFVWPSITHCKACVVAPKTFVAQIPRLQEAMGHTCKSQNCLAVSVSLTEVLL